jgi:hypothetical protein
MHPFFTKRSSTSHTITDAKHTQAESTVPFIPYTARAQYLLSHLIPVFNFQIILYEYLPLEVIHPLIAWEPTPYQLIDNIYI